MPVAAQDIEDAIRAAFEDVVHFEIKDQSGGCGQNYSIILVSKAFEGMNTLKRHRLINEVLKEQIAQLHAFSQKTFTPTQYEAYLAKGVS